MIIILIIIIVIKNNNNNNNNNLCGKLVSTIELPIKFDERFKVTSAAFFYCIFRLIKLWISQFYI